MTIEEYITIIKNRIKQISIAEVKQVTKCFPKDSSNTRGTHFIGFKLDHWLDDRDAIHALFEEFEKLARQKDKIRFWFYLK